MQPIGPVAHSASDRLFAPLWSARYAAAARKRRRRGRSHHRRRSCPVVGRVRHGALGRPRSLAAGRRVPARLRRRRPRHPRSGALRPPHRPARPLFKLALSLCGSCWSGCRWRRSVICWPCWTCAAMWVSMTSRGPSIACVCQPHRGRPAPARVSMADGRGWGCLGRHARGRRSRTGGLAQQSTMRCKLATTPCSCV
jgi:hypothetical protein